MILKTLLHFIGIERNMAVLTRNNATHTGPGFLKVLSISSENECCVTKAATILVDRPIHVRHVTKTDERFFLLALYRRFLESSLAPPAIRYLHF